MRYIDFESMPDMEVLQNSSLEHFTIVIFCPVCDKVIAAEEFSFSLNNGFSQPIYECDTCKREVPSDRGVYRIAYDEEPDHDNQSESD